MHRKKRKMKAGDAFVGMKRSGSQLQEHDQSVPITTVGRHWTKKNSPYLRRQNMINRLTS